MKLTEGIHLVGSGSLGFDLTDNFDCHVYLLDGGDELALVDTGAGLGAEAILDNVRRDGLDPARIHRTDLANVSQIMGRALFLARFSETHQRLGPQNDRLPFVG